MRYASFLLVYVFSFILFSCKNQEKHADMQRGLSWVQIVDSARKNNKGILLTIESRGCSICQQFWSDLNSDPDLLSKISKQYILVTIFREDTKNDWIHQACVIDGYPTYLILDKNLQLQALTTGYRGKNTFLSQMNEITNGHKILMDGTQMGLMRKERNLPSESDILLSFQYTLSAQRYWDTFILDSDSVYLSNCISELEKSVQLFSDIYNQFLLAKAYSLQDGKKEEGKMIAMNALQIANKNNRSPYIGLRPELKKMIDPNYVVENDPYVECFMQSIILDSVTYRKPVEVAFKLYNKGKQEIVIDTVQPSCDCMKIVDYKNRIIPGDSINIFVEFTPDVLGKFYRYIFILGNAINMPQMLSIEATVKENHGTYSE